MMTGEQAVEALNARDKKAALARAITHLTNWRDGNGLPDILYAPTNQMFADDVCAVLEELERMYRIQNDASDYLLGISRQTAEMAKSISE